MFLAAVQLFALQLFGLLAPHRTRLVGNLMVLFEYLQQPEFCPLFSHHIFHWMPKRVLLYHRKQSQGPVCQHGEMIDVYHDASWRHSRIRCRGAQGPCHASFGASLQLLNVASVTNSVGMNHEP